MTVKELYDYINYLARKDPTGNTISQDDYNLLLPIVVYEYFKRLFGSPEDFQKGAPVPVMGYGKNIWNEDKLSVLKSEKTGDDNLILDSDGKVSLPDDYFHLGNMVYRKYTTQQTTGTATGTAVGSVTQTGAGWTVNEFQNKYIRITSGTIKGQVRLIASNTSDTITVDSNFTQDPGGAGVTFEVVDGFEGRGVEYLNEQKFEGRKSSSLLAPSTKHPIVTRRGSNFVIYPDTLESVNLYYLKTPTNPVMDYAIDEVSTLPLYLSSAGTVTVTNAGSAGDTIDIDADTTDLGDYTVQSGDTVADIMKALVVDINDGYGTHGCKAAYYEGKVWIEDVDGNGYSAVDVVVTGGVTATDTNFTSYSTQIDWEDDIEAMQDIAELLLDKVAISLREPTLSQYSEMKKQND